MENKRGKKNKYFNSSVVMLVFLYIYLKLMQPVTITVKKSTGGFRFDYASYWILTIDPALFNIIQFD